VLLAAAVGVKVVTENSRQTFFGKIVGQNTAVVRGRAAASIQPLAGTGAPWVVCGSTANSGYDFLTDSGGGDETNADTGVDPDDSLKTMTGVGGLLAVYGWNGTNATDRATADPNATLIIQKNTAVTKCGAHSASADGRGGGQALTGNGMVAVTSGNGTTFDNSNTSVPVGNCYTNGTGAQPCIPCPTGTGLDPKKVIGAAGCDVLLPIVDWADGNGSNISFHVVTEAVMHVENGSGNEKMDGWLDDPSGFHLTSGASGTGTCPPGAAPCVVKLVDFPPGFIE
jgi:hypothetical protein